MSVISINSFLKFISSEIESIVVPAIFETIVLSSFTILLKNVDLPALGLPKMPIFLHRFV